LANKRLFIGVDEAGYGPNLGPLLICASAWLAPDQMSETELTRCFSEKFKAQAWRTACPHVPLGDSKKLFLAGGGLDSLEFGLLALLSQCLAPLPVTLHGLLAATSVENHIQQKLPWYDLDALSASSVPTQAVPTQAARAVGASDRGVEIQRLASMTKKALAENDIELLQVRGVVVTEPAFNEQVARSGSKGQLLSQSTLQLVATLLAQYPDLPAEVFCDRQGGRKNYLPVLLDAMPDRWFTEVLSSTARCSYRRQPAGEKTASCDIHFSVGGDSFPPTALASMLAKYLRERLMERFNSFWQTHLPELRPTAGYPVDARRFRAAIEATAVKLKLP
jgi:hypothetical protein